MLLDVLLFGSLDVVKLALLHLLLVGRLHQLVEDVGGRIVFYLVYLLVVAELV